MGLLDLFTGGKSDEASDALKRAERYFANIKTPTIQDLTLPELQKYVEAGYLTPAQAQAYIQDRNAYSDMNVNQTGTGAQIDALNRLSQIADAGAEGTPMQQAALENALQKMNTSVAGQRGAIEQQMAARGIPASLINAALQNQTVGQEAQQAHMDAVNAAAANYQAALEALSQKGALGSSLQGQQNAQANQVAQAANAMQQFNAQNQQQNAQFNAANQQAANAANAANKQQVSNNNVGLSNARTQYNANLPQQIFNNDVQKASGMAGAATNYGNLTQQQGGQNAAITAGLINLGTSAFTGMPSGMGQAPGGGGGGAASAGNALKLAPMMAAHGAVIPATDTTGNEISMADIAANSPHLPMGTKFSPYDYSTPHPAQFIQPEESVVDKLKRLLGNNGMPNMKKQQPPLMGIPGYAKGGMVDHNHAVCMARGGICMAEGGNVPGDANFSGDTTMNDMVPANLSPGEVVIPRSSVAQNPEVVSALLGDQDPGSQMNVQDVGTLLKAMRAIRMGAI